MLDRPRPEAETLIDRLYQMTFGKPQDVPWRSQKEMRQWIEDARRFIFDESMSRFVADLANEAWMNDPDDPGYGYLKIKPINLMRMAARLPYENAWFEYDFRAHNAREIQLAKGNHYDIEDDTDACTEGWLLHEGQGDHFYLWMFRRNRLKAGGDRISACGAAICWSTKDEDIYGAYQPDPDFDAVDSDDESRQFFRGILLGTHTEKRPPPFINQLRLCSIPLMPSLREDRTVDAKSVGMATGVMRRVWSVLATINDIPVIGRSFTRQSRGFMAKARYHQFLEHKVITLKVPQAATPKTLAKSLIAHAKRRAHMVRGHLRKDWRHPGTRLWVSAHQRGDASLGFVTHDYEVEH
jgi:hypothetical protein